MGLPERTDAAVAPSSPNNAMNAPAGIFMKTKMCRFHILGVCTKGRECSYAHTMEELQPVPDLFRTKMCKMLINTGQCDDPECRYAHSKEELRANALRKSGLRGGAAALKPQHQQLQQQQQRQGQLQQHQKQQAQLLKNLPTFESQEPCATFSAMPDGFLGAANNNTATIQFWWPGQLPISGNCGGSKGQAPAIALAPFLVPASNLPTTKTQGVRQTKVRKQDRPEEMERGGPVVVPRSLPFVPGVRPSVTEIRAKSPEPAEIGRQGIGRGPMPSTPPKAASKWARNAGGFGAQQLQGGSRNNGGARQVRNCRMVSGEELERKSKLQQTMEVDEFEEMDDLWSPKDLRPMRQHTEPAPAPSRLETSDMPMRQQTEPACAVAKGISREEFFVKNTFLDFGPRSGFKSGDYGSLHSQAGLLFYQSYDQDAFDDKKEQEAFN